MTSKIRIQRICEHCSSEFTAKTTVTKYCSAKCSKAAYKARKRGEKITAATREATRDEDIPTLQTKHFLTVKEASLLLGCSSRSIYRHIKENKIKAINLGQRMTRIKRADIDKLFEANATTIKNKPIKAFDIAKCYTIGEAQEKYGVSEKALHTILKRNKVQKMKKGRYVYVQQQDIDKLFSYEKN